MKIISIILFISTTILLSGCGGGSDNAAAGGGGGTGKAGCAWHGNCSSTAPHGAYDCNNDSIMQCNNGTWEYVTYCGTKQNSDGYYCNCKGGCGTSTVECSYATKICAGHEYETCGPTATRTLQNNKYICVED